MAAAMRRGAGNARALWLRCDLRLDDNPALRAACEGATSLLPVYVLDTAKFNTRTLAGAKKSSARRARFLLESIACMRKNLEAQGSGLAIAIGKAEDVLPQLCDKCDAVCVTQGICSEETREEARVERQLKRIGATVKREWGNSLYMPNECGCPPNGAPTLFTNFKNKAEGRGQIRNPLPAPKKFPPLPESGDALSEALRFVPTLEHLGYSAEEVSAANQDDPRGVMKFEGGEDAALHRMKKWMFDDDKLKDYFDIRNGMVGEGYSSKLSPWFAVGCISPRRVWLEAQRYEKERTKNKSTYWLIFELTWRDFYMYMGLTQGDKIFLREGLIGDKTPWTGSMDALQRWKDGRTNDPLVDANMRELKATGFMSNRGRQNVASYLIMDLGVDWRYGAAHFEEHLLDHDPTSNWGNWVAAAGLTGQRVNRFNTKKQLNDYDPRREYVDLWLKGNPGKLQGKGENVTETEEEKKAAYEQGKREARARRFGTDNQQAQSNAGGYPSKGSGKSKGEGKGRGGGFSERGDAKKGRWRRADHDAKQEGAWVGA